MKPLIRTENFIWGMSSHPHRLGRPVVVPNSAPIVLRCHPTPCSVETSVGNGPSPTLVQ